MSCTDDNAKFIGLDTDLGMEYEVQLHLELFFVQLQLLLQHRMLQLCDTAPCAKQVSLQKHHDISHGNENERVILQTSMAAPQAPESRLHAI